METTPLNPVAIVLAWQDAANAGDLDRLATWSSPEIEVAGPRGSGHGLALLAAWVGRAGLSLTTRRIFARESDVVVAQHGQWRSPETGAPATERDLATWFRVAHGQVARLARFDTLDDALVAAGLTRADERPSV